MPTRGWANVDINDPRGGYRVGGYRERPVPTELRAVVDSVWSFVDARPRRPSAHRIVPETGVSICAVFCPLGGVRDGPSRLMLMGPIGSPRVFEPTPGMRMVGVRLKAEWCRDILDVEPADHLDRWEDVDPGPGDPLARLAGQAADRSRTERSALLAAVGRLWETGHPSRDARLAHEALEAIRRQPGCPLDGRRRSEGVGVSSRHLRRVVKRVAGAGLKRFHRIWRLHRALSAATVRNAPEWSVIALEAGYSDQAHLIREFRSLAGVTPGGLHRERLALGVVAPT